MSTAAGNFRVVEGGLSVNEIMRKSRLAAARRRRMKKLSIVSVVIALIIVFTVIIFANVVRADITPKTDNSVKGFTCITLSPDDTLWSIACEYSDEHYNSVYQYIREVKEINGLTSDSIYAGSSLIIPVYTTPDTSDSVYTVTDDICQGY